jgi:AmiR/NasT family two-component response regulator
MGATHLSRLLLIDHDAAYARRLDEALSPLGHECTVGSSVDETLAAVRCSTVDLAVIDPAACGGLGLVLARQLRDALAIPFICLAESASQDEVLRATGLGALAFLVRPPDAADCLPAITVALGVALAQAADRQRAQGAIASLERAVAESRAIGFAVGLLMERLGVDRTQAFEALRDEARLRRQRIAEVAETLLAATELINGLQGDGTHPAQLLAS